MQTTINKDMAVGIPGTHGNGQPYFADAYIAGEDVTMGGVAMVSAAGKAMNYDGGDGSAAVGIFVNPNEHVRMVLPSDEMSLVVRKGDTVAIAKKGAWYVGIPTADAVNWTDGAKLKYDAATKGLKVDAAGTVAEILRAKDGIALIRFF